MNKKFNSTEERTASRQSMGFQRRNGSKKLEQHSVQAALQQHIYAGIIFSKKNFK